MYSRRVLVYVVLWSLCFIRLAPLITAEPVSNLSKPVDWDSLCPYTDFCTHKAARPFNYSDSQKPCCDPCSCEPDCGRRRNCCRYSMDKYRLDEKYATRCTWLSTAIKQMVTRHTYMTVDTCPDQTSCYHFRQTAPWGPMYPVVSKHIGVIYLNEMCALCHNDTSIEYFQIEANCPVADIAMYDSFVSEGLRFALSDTKAIDTGCFFRFLSPPGFDLSYQACFETTFFHCRQSDASEEEKARCQSFNATYSFIRTEFANIYCYMCALRAKRDIVYVCNKDINEKAPNIPFSFLLGFDELVALAKEYNEPEPEHKHDCLKTELMERKTGQCRKLRCPEGQIMLEDKCSFLSQEWTAGPFVSFLRLDPYTPQDRFPVEHLPVLASHKGRFFKSVPKSWLKEQLLLHRTPENASYVSYFVLRLLHQKTSFKPWEFLGRFKRALESVWVLKVIGMQYRLKASINKYYSYGYCELQHCIMQKKGKEAGTTMKPDHINREIRSCAADVDGTEDIVQMVRKTSTDRTILEMAITDFFYCRQVDLKPWEYSAHEYSILVHAINRTLRQAEYRQAPGLDGNVTVSVCVDTLGSDFWLHSGGAGPGWSHGAAWGSGWPLLVYTATFLYNFVL